MKYILLVISIAFIFSCTNVKRKDKPAALKYKAGDMVYLKPDSTLVLITEVDGRSCACGGDAQYKTKAKSSDIASWNVNESDIFGLKEIPEQF